MFTGKSIAPLNFCSFTTRVSHANLSNNEITHTIYCSFIMLTSELEQRNKWKRQKYQILAFHKTDYIHIDFLCSFFDNLSVLL